MKKLIISLFICMTAQTAWSAEEVMQYEAGQDCEVKVLKKEKKDLYLVQLIFDNGKPNTSPHRITWEPEKTTLCITNPATWPAGFFSEDYPGFVENGKFSVWYKNGNKYIEETYKNGKIEGEAKEWAQSGRLMRITPYKNGKATGIGKHFYADGSVMSGVYRNGQRDSAWTAKRADGRVQSVSQYSKGDITHYTLYSNETNKVIVTTDLPLGKEIGKMKFYNDDGSFISEKDVSRQEFERGF